MTCHSSFEKDLKSTLFAITLKHLTFYSLKTELPLYVLYLCCSNISPGQPSQPPLRHLSIEPAFNRYRQHVRIGAGRGSREGEGG